ncbi:hypothetical protein [Micromonospora sp. NPDC049102]|uniref:hypothetical protein n=1 Tax=Micromonospora sp. NPDC049102 TaxID=3364265 RepID=UPI0037177FAA
MALATLMLLPVGATAAQAATTSADRTTALYEIVVETTNSSATAYLEVYNGWALSVCDDAKDGFRARAEMRNLTTNQVIARAEDANGSFNTCSADAHAYPTPKLSDTVQVSVWVQDGASSTTRRYIAHDYY